VANALAKDPERVIQAVIDQAMRKDNPGGYGRQTVFDAAIEKMINDVAVASAKEWINEQAPKIKAAVRQRFEAHKSKWVAQLCDKLSNALVTNLHVSVSIRDNQ
jgi:hypothetical protein